MACSGSFRSCHEEKNQLHWNTHHYYTLFNKQCFTPDLVFFQNTGRNTENLHIFNWKFSFKVLKVLLLNRYRCPN